MSLITIYYRKPSALERAGINAANQSAFTAANTAIRYVKIGAYAQRLLTVPEVLSYEDMLSLDGSKSPYEVSSGEVLRNVLMLSTNDDSLRVQFADVSIRVGQVNTIKSTPLTKKSGSFKEYIQATDYQVMVRGNLISNGRNAFPYDMLQGLIRILKQPEALKVANKYLEAFDITKMVLRNADYDQSQQKFVNILPFSLNFESDEDYELQVD